MKKILLIITISIASVFSFGLTFAGSESGNLASPDFMVEVNTIYPGIKAGGTNTEETANWILGTIIQNMMIVLGAISILVMTIGAGFMILNSGDESMLTNGKTIFMSGIYAMVIALGSYYIVAIVRFLLYNVN